MSMQLNRDLLGSAFLLIASAYLSGCGSSDAGANAGTANATACAESDLIAQCPPNTMADLSSVYLREHTA